MTESTPHPAYQLEIEPVSDQAWADVPPEPRLRRLIKTMLRSYGFRVTHCARVDPPPPAVEDEPIDRRTQERPSPGRAAPAPPDDRRCQSLVKGGTRQCGCWAVRGGEFCPAHEALVEKAEMEDRVEALHAKARAALLMMPLPVDDAEGGGGEP